eukprot:CAMPEP_0119365576 /NCGR_PEP_ID=MMETSP1334-20130426/12495_1 /TAXON_ID=127549 /ORGANISM="Calcidiscus leptoporus, Strain RCC1130" /LENGTH=324 /DNA_ID=CAMNT_0007381591 /DNA_START=49 /DNA_END=1020 /DNA_ORIENTATION=+
MAEDAVFPSLYPTLPTARAQPQPALEACSPPLPRSPLPQAPSPLPRLEPDTSLPAGWEAHTDEASHMIYYVHSTSGRTSFERPTHFNSLVEDAGTAGCEPHCESSQSEEASTLSERRRSSQGKALHGTFVKRIASSASSAIFGSAAAHEPTTDARRRILQSHRIEQVAAGTWKVFIDASPAPRTRAPEALGPFASLAAAEAHARAVVPPKWQAEAGCCMRCGQGFALLKRRTHCRNCGFTFCHACCSTWPKAAVPATYANADSGTVRVCLVCEFNGTRWRDALLSGDLPLVMQAYSGGLTNVNLFSPLVAQGQATMLAVHYAAA